MNTVLLFADKVRIAENTDWVVFVLLTCIALILFMMISLQRDSTIREFLLQGFADSSNGFVSWVVTSVVFCLAAATLISQYIPFVPQMVADFDPIGFQFNKFGYTLFSLAVFYLLKVILGFVFYQATGNHKRWALLYFTNTRFYFVMALLMLAAAVTHYYLGVDKQLMFHLYIWFFAAAFIFKIVFYLLHKNRVLPAQWYYKFLYICTLQIVPMLLLWKVLFI